MLKHAFIVSIFLAGVAAQSQAVTIDTVPVGNAGNQGDNTNGTFVSVGGVGYNYRIGTYEVTVGQYTEFLNSVAATDTFSLYNTSMATVLNIAGISRSGVSGSYNYSVIGSANKPVTYVNWGDAARFSNWLHNGQPGLGSPAVPQNALSTESGAYTLNGANLVPRNAGAQWFIPSSNESYKAAFHKNDGVTNHYWRYPTSTDSFTNSDQPPGSDTPTPSNTGNYYRDDGIANGYNDGYAVTGSTSLVASENYLTDVGAYTLAKSPYGTFDQGGNVEEFTEAGFRTGASYVPTLGNLFPYLRAANYFLGTGDTPQENARTGFRVATVPEPSSFVLAALGLTGLVVWRRRKR
jgi:hypothetical protein